ncbi:ATP-dependent DNA helicase, UvrD/REP family protein [Bacillus sp. NRRL B-14911]|nr:ATP-dependent DNA helicase, UvrD/REP family protein [Bacillus sp. NRRL B-14911]
MIMYQKLATAFNTPAPLAEVYPPTLPKKEDDYYFQLLSDYGIHLNEPQKEAVKAVDGPVAIISGAGSGKTTVLTCRIGYMIHSREISPSNILLVTYTKKASVEMIERLARIPGLNRSASRSVVSGTYHSVCLRILRAEGYNFRVLGSTKKQHYIIKSILKKMVLQDSYSPEVILNIISSWKNEMVRPQDIFDETQVQSELKEIYTQYEAIKENENLYDYDDLIVECYWLFRFNPDILKKYQKQFQYILCDEFQDSSKIQYEIIRMLAEPNNNLCLVGDDSQSIYGFRGGTPSFLIFFDIYYPNCRKILMDINYRSGQGVIGLADSIISHNEKQIKKKMRVVKVENNFDVQFSKPINSEQEADWIVEDIKEKQAAGMPLREIAVLYRTHAVGRAVFERLLLSDVPFVTFGGSSETIYSHSVIRPLLSLLRVATNLMDSEAIVDAAPILYISRREMEETVEEVVSANNGETPKDLFIQVINKIANKKNGFQQRHLLTKLECIKGLSKMTAPQAIRDIRKGTINYERQLELDERKTLTLHKEMLIELLEECEQASRGFQSIKAFLSFVERVEEKNEEMEELRSQPDIEAVRLMTIHSSKGLEFEVVYAIGMIEKILPHSIALDTNRKEDTNLSPEESLEEERRLAYVCITRVKKCLYLSAPKTYRGEKAKVSRFLLEGLGIEKGEEIHV